MEAEFFGGDGIGGDELFDSVEDDLEVLVVFLFKLLDFSARSLFDCIRERSWTKVRMIAMLTSTARWERRTEESIATPCSVKA